jgi:hypothetical protein
VFWFMVKDMMASLLVVNAGSANCIMPSCYEEGIYASCYDAIYVYGVKG